jgi:carbon-monoxide dehydrogenase small subunit
VKVELRVNGRDASVEAAERDTLADVVRTQLGLTGTNVGCEVGICGACTVLVDGAPVRSCLLFAWQAADREVVTIEGAADVPAVACVQRQVHERQGFQCGFCTPGFIMLLGGCLARGDADDLEEVVSANVCRCTGYRELLEAAHAAAAELRP